MEQDGFELYATHVICPADFSRCLVIVDHDTDLRYVFGARFSNILQIKVPEDLAGRLAEKGRCDAFVVRNLDAWIQDRPGDIRLVTPHGVVRPWPHALCYG